MNTFYYIYYRHILSLMHFNLYIYTPASRNILVEHSRWDLLVTEAQNFMDSGGKLSETADR